MSEQQGAAPSAEDQEHERVLAPLRAKYKGRIEAWVTEDGELVVAAKPENPAAYKTFFDELNNDKLSNSTAFEAFALECIVHPEREQAARIVREWPALATEIARTGQEMCKGAVKRLGKK